LETPSDWTEMQVKRAEVRTLSKSVQVVPKFTSL